VKIRKFADGSKLPCALLRRLDTTMTFERHAHKTPSVCCPPPIQFCGKTVMMLTTIALRRPSAYRIEALRLAFGMTAVERVGTKTGLIRLVFFGQAEGTFDPSAP
jgi:hypothetical protein